MSQFLESLVGQGVKTPPFHGGITGSNPVRGTDEVRFMRTFLLPLVRKDQKYKSATCLPAGRRHNAEQ
jgi:hypothetical protein